MQIKESVALVTGANRGIGRALVDALLERGAGRVYAAARDLSALADVVRRDARVQAIRLDVRNPSNVITAFLPTLERHRGAIVNMLTLVALASMPGLSAYNASKAAGLSLTQSFRADLAKRGVAVHGVFPGAVDTDMIRSFAMPKTPAIDVARATLDGIEAGVEDIFPDPMSQQLYTAWRQDHKAVEKQFASM